MKGELHLQARITSNAFDTTGAYVRSVRGVERLAALFELEVVVIWPLSAKALGATDAASMPHLDDVAGAPVSVHLEHRSHALGGLLADALETREIVRSIHGLVASVSDRLDAKTGDLVLTLRVVPRAHNLELVETYQVFLETSLPDILRAKLEGGGLVEGDDYELRLEAEHAPIDFVAQYRETDLAFVKRLCEHRGITVFVEHGDDRDQLVITDHNAGFPRPDVPPLVVNRPDAMVLGGVLELTATRTIIPSLYIEMDYNYRTPQVDLTSQHELADAYGGGIIEYGAHYRDPDQGASLAAIRAEERRAGQLVLTGTTSRGDMAPGRRMTVAEDVRFSELELLITEVHHDLVQPATIHDDGVVPRYTCRFVGIPADRRFRPARATPRPRIHGVLHAIVDPLPNDEIGEFSNLDAEGRYTVRMYFDVAGSTRTVSSKRVRMIQGHAGGYYGTHVPLKPGIEVMVAFVDGDPDRPVIVGAVPNPVTPSPVTADNHTMSRIKTVSGVIVEMKDRG